MKKTKKYLTETVKYMLRSYPVIRPYIREVESLYEMDADQLRARNEKRFLSIFRMAYDKSPFYHRLYTDAGIKKEDITSLDDIKKLPVVTKEMVKQHADEMLTVPRWQVITAHTSGTTGSPLRVYENWTSIWREQAYLYCYRRMCGYTYGQPLVSLRGNLVKQDIYLKVHISNTLFLSSYNINKTTVNLYYEQIKKHQPIAIEGYPSSLYSLALLMRDRHLQLHIPLTFTSSETLLDHQRSLIKQQFNTTIFDHFGTTERTISLNESINHNGYYEDPGYSINEYTRDGEITTSLINYAFPLIRYEGHDVIEMKSPKDEKCQLVVNNRKWDNVFISKIIGRNEDYIFCKDDSRVMRLGFILKGATHVRTVQLVQREKGSVCVLIVPEVGFNNDDERYIVDALESRVGKGNLDIIVKIGTESDLIYTKRGKFKYLINIVNNGVMGKNRFQDSND